MKPDRARIAGGNSTQNYYAQSRNSDFVSGKAIIIVARTLVRATIPEQFANSILFGGTPNYFLSDFSIAWNSPCAAEMVFAGPVNLKKTSPSGAWAIAPSSR